MSQMLQCLLLITEVGILHEDALTLKKQMCCLSEIQIVPDTLDFLS